MPGRAGLRSQQIASDGGDDSETSGFPLETGEPETGDPQPETDSDTDTDSDSDAPEPKCDYPGTVCGEMSICQCSCDTSADCCSCMKKPGWCVDDSQCKEGQRCGTSGVENVCLPNYCEDRIEVFSLHDDADPAIIAGQACVDALMLYNLEWADLSALADLRHVQSMLLIYGSSMLTNLDQLAALEQVGELVIDGNPTLTSVQVLAGLQRIRDLSITNNPLLPTADIHAVLGQVPVSGALIVCGNLDDNPC